MRGLRERSAEGAHAPPQVGDGMGQPSGWPFLFRLSRGHRSNSNLNLHDVRRR